jgi:hypothetical protein
MRNSLFIVTIIALALASCEANKEVPPKEIVFKIGNDLVYQYSDIELYDSSTHILYFKEQHPEFKDIEKSTFSFYADGISVYTGSFWPAYYSSIPPSPFISTPMTFEHHYMLRILDWNLKKPDVRNDPRLIQALNDHNLLHSGLSVVINPLVINGNHLSFSFTVTNNDTSDLLILDPTLTGPNLFHYFTNGLTIRDQSYNIMFESNIEHISPEPWNSWKGEWLSQLKSGDSKTFTIEYLMNTPLVPGEYVASFEFPGLTYQVSREELFRDNDRVWLGDVMARRAVTIQ